MAELFMNINDDPNHLSTMSRLITWCPWRDSNPSSTPENRRKLLKKPGISTFSGDYDFIRCRSFAHSCGQSVGKQHIAASIKTRMHASVFI